jgi:hypothetical protein
MGSLSGKAVASQVVQSCYGAYMVIVMQGIDKGSQLVVMNVLYVWCEVKILSKIPSQQLFCSSAVSLLRSNN